MARPGQVLLAEPVAAVHGQPFVLRAESPPATIGGGRVLQPSARRYRRRDRAAIERLKWLRSSEPIDRVRAAIAFLGLSPWTERRLAALVGLPSESVQSTLEELARRKALVELPVGPRRTVRVLGEFAADLEDRVLRAVGRLHAAHPRQSAIPRVHLAAELPDLASDALVSGLLERLKRQGRIVADGRTVALKGHEAKLSQGERRLKQELAEAIRAGGISPPDVAELTASAGPRAAVVPDLLALLRDEQRLVEINPGLYVDADADSELRRKVRERLADGSTMTMAELRDLLGTTRKYSVPIGEYLDRIGLTRRDGDVRRLGDAASAAEAP
jgi:selenocysteine-specific elongation factor